MIFDDREDIHIVENCEKVGRSKYVATMFKCSIQKIPFI
jgi:hypothetical protein